MNAPIVRLFALFLVLFGVLVVFTTRWTVLEAEDLQANARNQRPIIAEQMIRRGAIRAADNTLLARSVPGEAGLYRRQYTEAARDVAHVVGYSYVDRGRAGIEQSRNAALVGERSELTSLVDELRGRVQEGDDVRLTIDLAAQRRAIAALGGRKGSVVAIEPATGRVKVMVSVPGFDPGAVRDARAFTQLSRDEENSPLLNRATQAGYPPGSTFKVVTAAAALDAGDFTPQSTLDGSSPQVISGVPLSNFGGQSFGPTTLTTALTQSVNTVWAQVAVRLGGDTMREYMDRFGFYARPPLDYPDDQELASGVYVDGELLEPGEQAVDVGRVGIGQERLRVTPLQMAMVAAGVANDGRLMRPTLTRRIVDRDGRTVEDIEPRQMSRVMSRESARALGEMMENVVREGSGTAGALAGISVAGKTGTAEIVPQQDINQPWFIAFAPADDPKAAIAVTVERSQGGTGGAVAAPIARQVLEELVG